MRIRTAITSGVAALALVAAGVGVATSASASIPAPVAGNITVLGSGVRVVASPGQIITGGETQTVKLGGETFQGQSIPANATGVTLSVANNQSSGAGQLRVWTTDAGQPGNPTISWDAGRVSTSVVFVGLNDTGKINVSSTVNGRYLIAVVGFVTPVVAPAAPVTMTIPATTRAPIKVGGSIRARGTAVGSVTLPAGTWDARATGSFRGLNSTNNTVPAGVNLSGTFVLVKGDGTPGDDTTIMAPDFSNNITAAVPNIPRVSSATLTVDPTAPISDFITVPPGQTLKVTAVLFAAASDSSQSGSEELLAGLDFAKFVKLG